MILDFVLTHLDYNCLETEQDKIQYFVGQPSLSNQLLPTKRYAGAIHKEATRRYFVGKFPMFFGPNFLVVGLTFIDPGWESLKSFEDHLFSYKARSLFAYRSNDLSDRKHGRIERPPRKLQKLVCAVLPQGGIGHCLVLRAIIPFAESNGVGGVSLCQ